jgi:uncharacterized membrane protein
MGLVICNSYTASISTAIMFYSPDTCGGEGGNYQMIGWYNFDPGTCGTVYENDLEDAGWWWGIYGQADDGMVWAGPYGASVPLAAFNQCYGIQAVNEEGDGFTAIGFREFDFGGIDDATVNFTA